MGKTKSIKIDDEFVLEGVEELVKELNISFSSYVNGLIKEDIKKRRQYKIIAYYDNGMKKEEEDFYSLRDLLLSVNSYKIILEQNEPMPWALPDEVRLIGYEVYEYGKIVSSKRVV